jgi:hypothetical protein
MHRYGFIALIACGGKSAPAPQPTHQQEDHHAKLLPELVRFHDVLAPRWHAAKGPERIKATCDAVPEFRARAEDVAKATPPDAANADAWAKGTKLLVTAVGQLGDACAQAPDTFELAFAEVHTSFEVLAETTMHEH